MACVRSKNKYNVCFCVCVLIFCLLFHFEQGQIEHFSQESETLKKNGLANLWYALVSCRLLSEKRAKRSKIVLTVVSSGEHARMQIFSIFLFLCEYGWKMVCLTYCLRGPITIPFRRHDLVLCLRRNGTWSTKRRQHNNNNNNKIVLLSEKCVVYLVLAHDQPTYVVYLSIVI